MQLRHLTTLLAVVDHGTVLGAATALNLAPSSVSAQLRSLETELGTTLFQRSPTGMKPTVAGAIVARQARLTTTQWDAVQRQLSTAQAPLRMISTEHMVATQVPAVMREFDLTHPATGLAIDTAENRGDMLAAVRAGAADVGLLLDSCDSRNGEWLMSDVAASGLQTAELAEVATAIAVSPDHPLAGRERVKVTDLAQHRVIVGPRRCALHIGLERILPSLEAMPSLVIALSWAANGMAAAIVPKFVVGSIGGNLEAVEVDVAPYQSVIRMVWSADRANDPAVRGLLYATRAAIAAAYPNTHLNDRAS